MAEVENDISKDSLESSNVRSRIERLQKVMEKLDEEVRRKNEIISKSNNETTRRNAVIERKQNIIDQYNKKLEHMISSAGVSACRVFGVERKEFSFQECVLNCMTSLCSNGLYMASFISLPWNTGFNRLSDTREKRLIIVITILQLSLLTDNFCCAFQKCFCKYNNLTLCNNSFLPLTMIICFL